MWTYFEGIVRVLVDCPSVRSSLQWIVVAVREEGAGLRRGLPVYYTKLAPIKEKRISPEVHCTIVHVYVMNLDKLSVNHALFHHMLLAR